MANSDQFQIKVSKHMQGLEAAISCFQARLESRELRDAQYEHYEKMMVQIQQSTSAQGELLSLLPTINSKISALSCRLVEDDATQCSQKMVNKLVRANQETLNIHQGLKSGSDAPSSFERDLGTLSAKGDKTEHVILFFKSLSLVVHGSSQW